MKTMRNLFVWIGLIVGFILNNLSRVVYLDTTSYIIGMVFVLGSLLYGCYLWTRIKNRHWLFMLWGLLSPIGLLGISLLKDKAEIEDKDRLPNLTSDAL